ncbi:MAG: hypothetical protein JWO19_1804 [Bryobacterales bacterium]|nr:hypothetical protein [Bryobacterales bacterium]
MASRTAFSLVSTVLLSGIVLGQTPPPEVEKALRARVTEFLQYHVDGNFRKAYEMVADDTKDDYFNSGKVQLKGFSVDGVEFTDNFTKAKVTATMRKMFNVQGVEVPVAMPSTTTWKIENGKWVWYNEPQATPWITALGPSVIPAPTGAATPQSNDKDTGVLPKDFNDQSIAAAARSILQQVSVDKTEITLASDKTSEDKVVFHNGMPGSVQLELNAPEIPGFTAKVEQTMVRAAADIPVVLRYQPTDKAERRDPINVQLTVQPLNRTFVIRVSFAAAGPVAPK